MSDGSHSDIDMDLSFPVPPNRPTSADSADILQRASGNAGKPPKPPVPRAKNGDVVDTFWDIPPIEFPAPDPGDEPTDGPRHAAPKGVPSTAETRAIASEATVNLTDLASGGDNTAGTIMLGAPQPTDGETTVAMSGASATAPIPSPERLQDTSAFSGTRLFPESGPAAQETAAIKAVPSLDFGTVISGEASMDAAPAAVADNGSPAGGMHGVTNPETPVRKRSRKPVIIAVISVVLVVAVAVGAALLWRSRENDAERNAALSACTGASEAYSTAQDTLDQALSDAQDEQAITADQVADAATVSALSDAIDEANAIADAAACSTSLSAEDLQRNAKTNQDLAQQLTDSAGTVTDAAKAVADSRDAKAEADRTNARNALQTAVSDAQALLDNSLWAVADNATRVTLEEAINAANALLQQQDDPDLKALRDAQTALQSASDGVNASMEELAAQNAQQNTTTDNGYYNGDYGYLYGNTGGDTTPIVPTPPTTPSEPQTDDPTDPAETPSPESDPQFGEGV